MQRNDPPLQNGPWWVISLHRGMTQDIILYRKMTTDRTETTPSSCSRLEVEMVVVVVVSASATTTLLRGGVFCTEVLSYHEGVILLQLERGSFLYGLWSFLFIE